MLKLVKLLLFGFSIFGGIIRAIISNIMLVGMLSIALISIGYVLTYTMGSPFRIIRGISGEHQVNFDAETLKGGRMITNSLMGRKYILFFTSSQCKKCQNQFSTLDSIAEENYVDLYAVIPASDAEAVTENLTPYNATFDNIILDKHRSIFHSTYAYILPHTSVVNEEGRIVLDITGKISAKDQRRIIEALTDQEEKIEEEEEESPESMESIE